MAPHSSTLARKIPWMEEPGRLRSMGSLESVVTEQLHFHSSLSHVGEGNGNPLQCSCLENPRDGGAWWAAVYGITRSQTQLKWLSSSSSSHPEMGAVARVGSRQAMVIQAQPIHNSLFGPNAEWILRQLIECCLPRPGTAVVLLAPDTHSTMPMELSGLAI